MLTNDDYVIKGNAKERVEIVKKILPLDYCINFNNHIPTPTIRQTAIAVYC